MNRNRVNFNSFNVGHGQGVGNYVLDKSNDTWVPAEASPSPYLFAVAEGDVSGHHPLFKYGARTSVAQATESSIWEGGTDLYGYLSSGQVLAISGASAADHVTGTGANTLTIHGLDPNYNMYQETINLSGTALVYTTGLFLRQNRAYVETCGAARQNVGQISIRNATNTLTTSLINAGEGQTLMALWTVPSGYTFYTTDLSVSTSSNKGAQVSVYIRQNPSGPWRIAFRQFVFQGSEPFTFPVPIQVPEMTDIEVRVTTTAAAGVTSFAANFGGWYETE